MRDDKENIIVSKSFDFALKVIEFAEKLEQDKKFVIANQILRLEKRGRFSQLSCV